MFRIGDGKLCKFWEDCWIQEVPIKLLYNNLYKLVRDPLCSVVDCWEEGSWVMDFRRSLSLQEYNSWLGLLDDLKDKALTDNKADSVVWALEKKSCSLLNLSTDS